MNEKNEFDCGGTNSFLEESYIKNLSSNHMKKDEMSFESSNQFSQTGTPISYQHKHAMKIAASGHSKNINIISASNNGSY
jgi:hypothetical protein